MNAPDQTTTTATILRYNDVVAYLLSEHRKNFGTELVDAQAKATVNRGLALLMTKAGITVRPKWIADLRAGAGIQYEKAEKVFVATNNLLKKFGFDVIPDEALKQEISQA